MRYIKVFMARGGSQNLRRQEGGVSRKPIFAYQGGGGVKKPENPAYIVYGWSPRWHVEKIDRCLLNEETRKIPITPFFKFYN